MVLTGGAAFRRRVMKKKVAGSADERALPGQSFRITVGE